MYNSIKVKVVCMKSLLKIGLLFSLIGVCSWFCFLFCTSEVMAEGIPYSTYGANGIYFYSPCWMSNGDDGAYGDGTSFKINPDASPADFWFYEQPGFRIFHKSHSRPLHLPEPLCTPCSS